jgi:type II secretory pathway component PulF
MIKVQGWLPEFDIALLSVGEKSGRLDESFKLLSAYYATRAAIIRDTIAGLLTTTATLHVFLLIFPLGYLTLFVTGLLENHFSNCLPFLLQKAAVFGILYGGVGFLIFASQGRRGERWRSLMEAVARKIPLLGKAQRFLVLARLAAALEALISAGVSIVNGWELAAAAAGSPRLRREVSGWKTQLENGVTPAELVAQAGYFPDMFVNLYNTGEQSGQLDDTLKRLSNYYQDEGFRKLRLFTRVLNGTIYGLVVLLVGFNIIRFYVGYINSAMQAF